jgi:hypothetical protein
MDSFLGLLFYSIGLCLSLCLYYSVLDTAVSSYNPSILLLGTYPKEQKSEFQGDANLAMFIAVLLTIVKKWKQQKYPLTSD